MHACSQSSWPAIQSERNAILCMSFHATSVRQCLACKCSFGLSAIRQSSNILFTNGFLDPWSACVPSTNISDAVTVGLHDNLSLTLQYCMLKHDNTTCQTPCCFALSLRSIPLATPGTLQQHLGCLKCRLRSVEASCLRSGDLGEKTFVASLCINIDCACCRSMLFPINALCGPFMASQICLVASWC